MWTKNYVICYHAWKQLFCVAISYISGMYLKDNHHEFQNKRWPLFSPRFCRVFQLILSYLKPSGKPEGYKRMPLSYDKTYGSVHMHATLMRCHDA